MSRTAPRPIKPDAISLLAALNPAASPEPAAVTGKSRKPKPGARAGTRLIAGHFPPTTLRALKHVMAEEEVTLQALLDEAIHDLLVKKGHAKLIPS